MWLAGVFRPGPAEGERTDNFPFVRVKTAAIVPKAPFSGLG